MTYEKLDKEKGLEETCSILILFNVGVCADVQSCSMVSKAVNNHNAQSIMV